MDTVMSDDEVLVEAARIRERFEKGDKPMTVGETAVVERADRIGDSRRAQEEAHQGMGWDERERLGWW